MATALSPLQRPTRLALPLWQAGIVSIALTALAAAAVYGVGRAVGTLPHSALPPTPDGEEPLTLMPVILASAQGALAASIVYALLRRFTARPARTLWALGAVVLVLSFVPFPMLDDVPGRMVATLVVLHVVAGVTAIATLTRLTSPMNSA